MSYRWRHSFALQLDQSAPDRTHLTEPESAAEVNQPCRLEEAEGEDTHGLSLPGCVSRCSLPPRRSQLRVLQKPHPHHAPRWRPRFWRRGIPDDKKQRYPPRCDRWYALSAASACPLSLKWSEAVFCFYHNFDVNDVWCLQLLAAMLRIARSWLWVFRFVTRIYSKVKKIRTDRLYNFICSDKDCNNSHDVVTWCAVCLLCL